MNDFEDNLLTITWGKQLLYGMYPGYAQQTSPSTWLAQYCLGDGSGNTIMLRARMDDFGTLFSPPGYTWVNGVLQ